MFLICGKSVKKVLNKFFFHFSFLFSIFLTILSKKNDGKKEKTEKECSQTGSDK